MAMCDVKFEDVSVSTCNSLPVQSVYRVLSIGPQHQFHHICHSKREQILHIKERVIKKKKNWQKLYIKYITTVYKLA